MDVQFMPVYQHTIDACVSNISDIHENCRYLANADVLINRNRSLQHFYHY